MQRTNRGYWFMAAVSALSLQTVACGGGDPTGCEKDFIDEGDGCIHEKTVSCDESKTPEHASAVKVDVKATYSSSTEKWSVPACDFKCEGEYVKDNGQCVLDRGLCDGVQCNDDHKKCELSSGDCVCVTDYIDEGAGCIHEKEMACDASKVPQGGTAISANVTATYSSAKQAWVAEACDFDCTEENYVKEDGTCVYHGTEEPATCKKDEYGKTYHKENGECVRDVHFESGSASVLGGDFAGVVGEEYEVKGSFDSGLCAAENREGRCPGVKAELCYGADSVKSFEELTCVAASYSGDASNKDDIYSAKVTFSAVGDYIIFYRWNGNGVDWYYSDAEHISKTFNTANPVMANIKEKEIVTGLRYEQNFDSLGKTQGKWEDDKTLPGWYTTIYQPDCEKATKTCSDEEVWNLDKDPQYYSSFGSTQLAGILNLGSQNSEDRALGTCSSNGYQPTLYLILENNTGKALSKITVSYTGEQWRNSANKNLDMEGILQFSYAVMASKPANVDNYKSGSDPFHNTTDVGELDFVAPIAGGTQTALDGNLKANQVKISESFNAAVPAGSFILFKWFDPRENGNNSMLGIDDLVIVGE